MKHCLLHSAWQRLWVALLPVLVLWLGVAWALDWWA